MIVDTRRSFLKKSALLALAAPALADGCAHLEQRYAGLRTANPRKAAVLWYSQTGHTGGMGRLMAHTLRRDGLEVVESDYRRFDASSIAGFDFIIMGSPVYYYRVPENLRNWISSLPRIDGVPAAAYVTFGGAGGNQHNTAYELLECLADRGAIPVRLGAFAHMSAFALTWSSGREARVLRYRDLPDETTFDRARSFARDALATVRSRGQVRIEPEFSVYQTLKHLDLPWWTKLLSGKHAINREKCIQCGNCEAVCPVAAVSYQDYQVERGRCIFCLGCVNNCPAGAMEMTYTGSEVYGYREFLRRNNISLRVPRELEGV